MLDDGQLKNEIHTMLEKCSMKIKGVFSADESKRSTHANAAFAGFGKSKKIIIFDTMLNNSYSNDEIIAVIAHEIGHAKKKHIIKQMFLSIILIFFSVAVILFILSSDFIYNSMAINKEFYAGLLIVNFLISEIMFFFKPLFGRLSRKYEYEADAYSKKITGSAEPLIATFKKFVTNDMTNINPHPIYEEFFYSHPSIIKRITELKK